MKFSVIIPYRNAEEYLPSCLQALVNQRNADAEFILVDNRSSDRSEAIVMEYIRNHPDTPMATINCNHSGVSAARNMGAERARGEWLVFTDSDCIPMDDWLANFAQAIEKDPSIRALAGGIVPEPSTNLIARFTGLYTLFSPEHDRVFHDYTITEGGLAGANFAVRKDLFVQIGRYDETMQVGEDHDFCRRIYAAGSPIHFVKSATTRHVHRKTLRGMIRQAYMYGSSHALLLRRIVPGALIVQLPLISIKRMQTRCRIWIDFNQADKKLIVSLIPGLFWPPLFSLACAYLVYLGFTIRHKALKRQTPLAWPEVPAAVFLLLMKSMAMTYGRMKHSLRYKVICL